MAMFGNLEEAKEAVARNEGWREAQEEIKVLRHQPVREPVAWFATQMEEGLKANDHKGGWRACSP